MSIRVFLIDVLSCLLSMGRYFTSLFLMFLIALQISNELIFINGVSDE